MFASQKRKACGFSVKVEWGGGTVQGIDCSTTRNTSCSLLESSVQVRRGERQCFPFHPSPFLPKVSKRWRTCLSYPLKSLGNVMCTNPQRSTALLKLVSSIKVRYLGPRRDGGHSICSVSPCWPLPSLRPTGDSVLIVNTVKRAEITSSA